MKNGLDTAFQPTDRPDGGGAFRYQASEIQRRIIRRPDLWEKSRGVKLSQNLRIYLVGFYPGMSNRLHLKRIGEVLLSGNKRNSLSLVHNLCTRPEAELVVNA